MIWPILNKTLKYDFYQDRRILCSRSRLEEPTERVNAAHLGSNTQGKLDSGDDILPILRQKEINGQDDPADQVG